MTKFVAFISGKGGVGKTTTALNVAHALTSLERKTVVMDANLNTPNLSFHLGIVHPEKTLHEFLKGEQPIHNVIQEHDSGISFIPSSPSYQEFMTISPEVIAEAFEHLDNLAEFVIVDAPSGLGNDVQEVLEHTDEAVVVVQPTISSIMDALKVLHIAQQNGNLIGGIVVNMSHRGRNELKLHDIEQVMGYPIIAHIYTDRKVRKSLHKQEPMRHLYPRSRTAKQFRRIAEHLSLHPR